MPSQNRITMLLKSTAIIAERRQEMPTRPLQIPLPRPVEIRAGEACITCDAEITRFDAELFFHTGRCSPCHEALKDD